MAVQSDICQTCGHDRSFPLTSTRACKCYPAHGCGGTNCDEVWDDVYLRAITQQEKDYENDTAH